MHVVMEDGNESGVIRDTNVMAIVIEVLNQWVGAKTLIEPDRKHSG